MKDKEDQKLDHVGLIDFKKQYYTIKLIFLKLFFINC